MALDRIPGEANLYIGGLFSLRRTRAVHTANITHIVSVLRYPPPQQEQQEQQEQQDWADELSTPRERSCKRYLIEIDDLEAEDVIQHFPAANAFIDDGLDKGGGVLVHCAMGKSRSATFLIAYLLTRNHSLTPSTALALIRQARPFAEPNPSFMDQLALYHQMGCPEAPADHPLYQRWLYTRHLTQNLTYGFAPERIYFSDQNPLPTDQPSSSSFSSSFRCRRCRTPLATTQYLASHSRPSCAHIFLEPLSWMRTELEQGRLSGRLACPNVKCSANIGKYAWAGMKCSCGEWVVPGICLARGRVDEARATKHS